MTSRIVIRELGAGEVRSRRAEFAAHERSFTYPLGADRFRIDHGTDYAAFFVGLGEPRVWVAEAAGRIAGVLVAVRRHMPGPVRYLCDFKVSRGTSGVGRALLEAFDDRGGRAEPAFGVSMDPARGPNRTVRAALRCRRVELHVGARLAIWSFDIDAWRAVAPHFEGRFGPLGFRDDAGQKDLVLESTGRRMPLLHLQHGRLARPNTDGPSSGHVHMACAPLDDPLTRQLAAGGRAPAATATLLEAGIVDVDWSQLLTSDI